MLSFLIFGDEIAGDGNRYTDAEGSLLAVAMEVSWYCCWGILSGESCCGVMCTVAEEPADKLWLHGRTLPLPRFPSDSWKPGRDKRPTGLVLSLDGWRNFWSTPRGGKLGDTGEGGWGGELNTLTLRVATVKGGRENREDREVYYKI